MKISTKNKISFVLCLFLSCWIIISHKHYKHLYDNIRNEIIEFIAPTLNFASSTIYAINSWTKDIGSVFTIFEDNKRLKKRNDFLEYYFYRYKQMKEENEELKKSVNFTNSITHNYVTAQIVYRSNNYLHQELIVNAGSKQGIEKWQMVVANNQLIGRITDVRYNTSSVLLITDHDSKIPAVGLNSKARFIAVGKASHDLDCKYLGDNKLEEGELVTTSYDSPLIIPNIIIGSVFEKDNSYNIRPIIDLDQLEFVQILQLKNE